MLTRNIINQNIIFRDVSLNNFWENDKKCSYSELSILIDTIKNLLQDVHNCKEGQTALIGIAPSILQIASFFACMELGLTVIIVDHSRPDNWFDPNYVDPKTESLLPINYFIVNSDKEQSFKHNLFYKISDKTIAVSYRNLKKLNSNANTSIGCTKNTIALKCTSSGTTGKAKVINHTHEFLYQLIQRNKVFYYGNICMAHNLNHGSSPATYFLPALCSEKVKNFVSFMFTKVTDNYITDDNILKSAYEKFDKLNLNHLMIPYSYMVENFLHKANYPNLIIYTLSYIKKDWLTFYNNKQILDVISFFGSNETSGPTFINKISDINFDESRYKKVDNFYNITLKDNTHLEIRMPIYNTIVSTNDTFKLIDDNYYHTGRNDLYRINGLIVDVEYYEKLALEVNASLIIDSLQNSLYLAFWENTNIEIKFSSINSIISNKTRDVHKINKYAFLEKNKFLTGVKLDMELLRDYFRKYVK